MTIDRNAALKLAIKALGERAMKYTSNANAATYAGAKATAHQRQMLETYQQHMDAIALLEALLKQKELF